MADRGRSEEFKTPTLRVGFDRFLYKPDKKVTANGPNKGQEFEEYGVTLIFPKTTSKALFEKAVMQACIDAKWGDEAKIIDLIKNKMIKSPFLDGDGKEARNKDTGNLHPGMGPDVWFIRTNSRKAPVVRYKSPNIPATPEEVYAGCYGFAVLSAYTWIGETGKGVSFGIQYLQKTSDGEPLRTEGGTVDPNKWHETIADGGDAPESTKTGAGASGLFG